MTTFTFTNYDHTTATLTVVILPPDPPLAPPVQLNLAPASLLNQAQPDQPMPEHLNHDQRAEIERLLLRIFPRDTDAIAFLSDHNHALRAKPLDLIRNSPEGASQLLAYLRQAAANQPPLDPVSRILSE